MRKTTLALAAGAMGALTTTAAFGQAAVPSWVLKPDNLAIPPGPNQHQPCKARVSGAAVCQGASPQWAPTFWKYVWDSFGDPGHGADVLTMNDSTNAVAQGQANAAGFGCTGSSSGNSNAKLTAGPGATAAFTFKATASGNADSSQGQAPPGIMYTGGWGNSGQTMYPDMPTPPNTEAVQPGVTQAIVAKTSFKLTAPLAWTPADIAAYAGKGTSSCAYNWVITTSGGGSATPMVSGPGFTPQSNQLPAAGTKNPATGYQSWTGSGIAYNVVWKDGVAGWTFRGMGPTDAFFTVLDGLSIGDEASGSVYADIGVKSRNGVPNGGCSATANAYVTFGTAN